MARLKRTPTKEEVRVVAAIEEHWHANKRFPALSIIGTTLGIEFERLKTVVNGETVQIMLSNRGIEAPKSVEYGLTPDQLAAANVYLNIYDTRPLQQKLREIGISPSRFGGWVKGKNFKAYLRERSEDLFEEGMPMAHRQLLDQIAKGNIKAIELFYQVSGRYTGVNSAEVQNIQLMMSRLLEAIQMEVGDQVVLARISERFNALLNGQTMPPPVGEPVRAEIHDGRPSVQPTMQQQMLQGILDRNANEGSM